MQIIKTQVFKTFQCVTVMMILTW